MSSLAPKKKIFMLNTLHIAYLVFLYCPYNNLMNLLPKFYVTK